MSTYALDPPLETYVQACAKFVAGTDDWHVRRARFAESGTHFCPDMPGISVRDARCQQVPVRIYQPAAAPTTGDWPTVLYLHGGGWCLGDHTTHDWFARALLARLPIRIVSVGYRLAPEHPFPAPLEDALTVWHALASGHWDWVDARQLAVVGDSAGATLAAGVCIHLHDHSQPQPALQGLIYPLLTARQDLPSMHDHAQAPLLSAADVHGALALYAPTPEQSSDPRALPLDAAIRPGVAPAFIVAAQYDPLFDYARLYAQALAWTGVPVEYHVGQGLLHGSLRAANVAEAERVFDCLASALARATAR